MGGQVLVRGGTKNPVLSLGATALAYASGNVIGVPTEIPFAFQDNNGTGVLQSLVVLDSENVKGPIDFYFFNQAPTSQGANGSAFALSAAELSSSFLGKVSVVATNYSSSSTIGEATLTSLGLVLSSVKGSKSCWVVAVARGAITFASVGSLRIRPGILQD